MLKGYEVKEVYEDGRVYAVVELDNGDTFGQIVSNVKTAEEMDSAIHEAVGRVTKQDQPSEIVGLVGQFRIANRGER